jgi:hypothetical protein
MAKKICLCLLAGAMLTWASGRIWAGYKARSWSVGDRADYAASLTSEGVTIAAEPLFTDALAARVFDKNDMVTRGIMPLAILIFNDNDFPVRVDGLSAELIHKEEHFRSLSPNEAVYRLFKKDPSWIDRPLPRVSRSDLNEDALDDFDQKFLMEKTVSPRDKGGGFLFLHIRGSRDLASYLSDSVVYIPNVYRLDDGSRMIYFEIELRGALRARAGD